MTATSTPLSARVSWHPQSGADLAARSQATQLAFLTFSQRHYRETASHLMMRMMMMTNRIITADLTGLPAGLQNLKVAI